MSYQDLDAQEFSHTFHADKGKYVLVDVRTPEEFAEGHIPGAILIPHDQMEERHGELAEYKDKPLLLICRSGKRSVFAAEVLAEHGYQNLYNLKGGMLQWAGPTAI